jgi:hypothetical protein
MRVIQRLRLTLDEESLVRLRVLGTFFCTHPGPRGSRCDLAKSSSLPPGETGGLD